MEPLWLELIKQAPNTAALIFIVVHFLRHIRDGERERTEAEEHKAKIFSDVIERNNLHLERTSEAIGRVAHLVDKHSVNGAGRV